MKRATAPEIAWGLCLIVVLLALLFMGVWGVTTVFVWWVS